MLDDPRRLTAALRHPTERLPALLSGEHSLRPMLLRVVLPLCCIRPLALLLRGAFTRALPPAAVLAVSALLLQLGTFAALALALPWVMRPFGTHLPKRKSLPIAAVMGTPLWLTGVVYVMPEDQTAVLLATRVAVLVLAAYGVLLLWLAMPALAVAPPSRLPIVVAAGATFCFVHLALSFVLGAAASVVSFTLDLAGSG